MISKTEARRKERELTRQNRPRPGGPELSRRKVSAGHTRGVCYVCGCKVYRTEIICGECCCEDDSE